LPGRKPPVAYEIKVVVLLLKFCAFLMFVMQQAWGDMSFTHFYGISAILQILSPSNAFLPTWLNMIAEDEQGMRVWQPRTKLLAEEQPHQDAHVE
jgi:hypothetical protein